MPAEGDTPARSFRGKGATGEHFLFVEAPGALAFPEQVAFVCRRYEEVRTALGLAPETAVFRRVFLSDVLNQAALVRESSLAADFPHSPVAVSIIQQPPLSGAKIALLAYHLDRPEPPLKERLSVKHMLVRHDGLGHLWSTRLCAGACDASADPVEAQTREVFEELIGALTAQGGTLRDHCIRTWLYIKNVDIFYQGLVDARTEIFTRHGLTPATHYLASTGIEGACAHRSDLVSMDAYSILGLVPGQVTYLNDFEYLCPTQDYHVTFERGTRVAYADRAHLFISGTASIDRLGRVVHLGDVLRQLDQALANVDALMRAGGSGLADLMYLIVYLRDPADYPRIEARLRERLPNLPRIIVAGAVCRPEWLIEVEGVGIVADHRPDLPSF
ncbi:putative aminoacrylate peracid reductase RutC [bacterium BMS3Bbin12]|nr:putative aminoacrylate peracid reductase RutC [bacterium BMS3Abin12]GBE47494.1 putative aminoacrylate peracid reductase RutC [bacterium BMS3Bbin12]GBE51157.1 putative aminoacrylate peracid reductase RutC [bacterium BMS3Bbin13]HDJ85566.1 hypothetical protein [Chromatiales bacterium]